MGCGFSCFSNNLLFVSVVRIFVRWLVDSCKPFIESNLLLFDYLYLSNQISNSNHMVLKFPCMFTITTNHERLVLGYSDQPDDFRSTKVNKQIDQAIFIISLLIFSLLLELLMHTITFHWNSFCMMNSSLA